MSRELTWKEQQHINRLSVTSPQLAIDLSKTLKENSYRKDGKVYYFQTPKKNKEKD